MPKRNLLTGSSLDEFLKEEGIFEGVRAKALKRALAEQLEEGMQAAKLTKFGMGQEDGRQQFTAGPCTGSR